MAEKNQITKSNLKVGILFNQPTKSSRGEAVDFLAEAGVVDEASAIQESLGTLGLKNQSFSIKKDILTVIKALKEYKPDVIINLSEGAFGESLLEMNMAAVLELADQLLAGGHGHVTGQ